MILTLQLHNKKGRGGAGRGLTGKLLKRKMSTHKTKKMVEAVKPINLLEEGQDHLGPVRLSSSAAQESLAWDLPVWRETNRCVCFI